MKEGMHVADILEKAKRALEKEDVAELRNLSNHTIHAASIYQDPDNIVVAVVLYALSKLIERRPHEEYPEWHKFQRNYIDCIDKASIALKKNNLVVYREEMQCIMDSINNLSGKMKSYTQDVFRQASISKASRLYEHGISLEKTAKILGLTIWELNQYVGSTGIANVNLAYTKELNDRIKSAQELFRK